MELFYTSQGVSKIRILPLRVERKIPQTVIFTEEVHPGLCSKVLYMETKSQLLF